jgi:hypothetical protein
MLAPRTRAAVLRIIAIRTAKIRRHQASRRARPGYWTRFPGIGHLAGAGPPRPAPRPFLRGEYGPATAS